MKTPQPAPPPTQRQLCLRHFRSPDRKPVTASASRHLKATSCFPVTLCQPRVVVLGSTPQKNLPRLHPSNSEGPGWWT